MRDYDLMRPSGPSAAGISISPGRVAYGVSPFYRAHLWWPGAVFVLLWSLSMGLGLDQWLADRIYAWQGHAWTLQSGYLTETVLHESGKRLSQWLWIGVLVTFGFSLRHQALRPWRKPLLYLLASVLLATALVAWMKRWTHMDCPWDLLRYGGEKPYYGLFTRLPLGVRPGGCFPAGHASAGFAWVASYFFCLATLPRWRRWALGGALALGGVFGAAQQLRGAHFLSHDLCSLMVCWLVALALYRAMRLDQLAPAVAGAGA